MSWRARLPYPMVNWSPDRAQVGSAWHHVICSTANVWVKIRQHGSDHGTICVFVMDLVSDVLPDGWTPAPSLLKPRLPQVTGSKG